ncbi:MAG: SDR family NAD(P)-dependent oxidoreductase [Rhodospirillales bacterium]|nr:SDR family NAD(P)-dependent oxidoreductase [Rhodospirillales bacterium]
MSDAAGENAVARYPSLAGKAVVVTGGASGIGAAIVEAFAGQSARVFFLDIDAASGEALARRIGGRAEFRPVDLADVGGLRCVIKAIEQEAGGGIDVLVNNAARDDRHDWAGVDPEHWRRMLAVNLDHQFFATQAVVPGMAARGGGSVILFGSRSWMRGLPNMVGYTTAKAAINGLTRTLAREFGGMGIRVNCVVPGAVVTERQRRLWTPPEDDARILDRQALKFRLAPWHVARVVLFVASAEAGGCSGANFIVDGGVM